MGRKKSESKLVVFPGGVPFDMDKMIQKGQKRLEAEIKELEASSKNLWELVRGYEFQVGEILCINNQTSYVEHNRIIGPGSGSTTHYGGYTSRLELQVEPRGADADKCPIRVLTFDGLSVVTAGDIITAKVPLFEEVKKKILKEFMYSDCHVEDGERIFYLPRQATEKEHAIEIVTSGHNTLKRRIDRGIGYGLYVKPVEK